MMSAGAQSRCSVVHSPPSAKRMLDDLSERYPQFFYQNSPTEDIETSFFLAKQWRLFKFNRMLKDLNKNGSKFDDYELADFVYRLDRLAFAHAAENNPELNRKLTAREKQALSESRRALLMDGIAKTFQFNKKKSGLFSKAYYYFSQSISWKYWRWPNAPLCIPKLVGISMPVELAKKIAWEGLEAHQDEVEKYIPAIRTRAGFNQFSRIYNWTLLTSVFTIVPYTAHAYYEAKMEEGRELAHQQLAPLVQTTEEMAQVDYVLELEIGAIEKYKVAYRNKHKRELTEEEMKQVQAAIHQKLTQEYNFNPAGEHP